MVCEAREARHRGTRALRGRAHRAAREPLGEPLRPVFEFGAIEYGRADFALVDGAPQVYEINTNPTIGRICEHPHPPRMEAARHCERRLAEALHGIDSPRGGKAVALDTRPFDKQRRKDSRLGTAHWTP